MENKKIWNLILNTNVRANDDIDGTCAYPMTVSYVYTGFDAAKRDFLRVIDKYAHSDNGLFDGEGGIPEFKRYIDSLELDNEEDFDETFDDDEDFDDDFGGRFSHECGKKETYEFIDSLKGSIASGFEKKPIALHGDVSYLISIDSSKEEVFVEGIDDGPPCRIHFNTLDMSDSGKDYYFEVNNDFDCYGCDESPKFLSIYLFNMNADEEFDVDAL